ncbi:EndoU domain-containing protein [Bacillus thuringiensis]|uniref:EndoU domain-containing protein n=1 Tax=Bacillus cereus group TaxID=86661 RepID=UPI00222467E5|nr:EndoU domain-containing protein [Bacillus thuringiensis]UYX55536.1 EndoU domain-containing protein [Bacillus thuringiensis]
MSLNMYLGEVQSQTQSMNAVCIATIQGMEQAIHEAYSNKRCISGRLYSGKTSEGMEIRFALINDKIITVYPMY